MRKGDQMFQLQGDVVLSYIVDDPGPGLVCYHSQHHYHLHSQHQHHHHTNLHLVHPRILNIVQCGTLKQ